MKLAMALANVSTEPFNQGFESRHRHQCEAGTSNSKSLLFSFRPNVLPRMGAVLLADRADLVVYGFIAVYVIHLNFVFNDQDRLLVEERAQIPCQLFHRCFVYII